MRTISFFLWITFAFGYCTSWGCLAPLEEQVVSWQELVKRTSEIVLVEVASEKIQVNSSKLFSNGSVRYALKKLKNLKGNSASMIYLKGFPVEKTSRPDFNSHKDDNFWATATNGLGNITADCKILPSFKTGERHLLFLTPPYHFKSFEKVVTDDDLWLRRVEVEILNQAKGDKKVKLQK